MRYEKVDGLTLKEKNGMIYLTLGLTIKRPSLWTFLSFLTLVFLAQASSLDEDTRRIILEFLIGAMQFVFFKEQHPKSPFGPEEMKK